MSAIATEQHLRELWDTKRLSKIILVSEDALRHDRAQGRGIPYIKLGKKVLYDPSDVHAYLERCKKHTVPKEEK